MREFSSSWEGSVSTRKGIARFSCGDKDIEFRMNSFEHYNYLCQLIDAITDKVEKRNQAAIMAYINSYQKAY